MAFQSKANLSSVASSVKNSSSKSSLSPAPKKQPNTLWVNLSSKLASNGKLTSDECKKHLKNNLCLYCSVGDHKLDSCPKKQTMVLQQLLPRNPWKNRKQSPGLHIDWGLHWTSLYSNKSNSTQRIHFLFPLPLPWSLVRITLIKFCSELLLTLGLLIVL